MTYYSKLTLFLLPRKFLVLSFLSESSIRYVDPQGKVIATEQQQGSTFDMNEKSCHFTEEFSDSCSVFCPVHTYV